MSVDANKELIRRFYDEVWNQGNTDFVFQVFADKYVRHALRLFRKAKPGIRARARRDKNKWQMIFARRFPI